MGKSENRRFDFKEFSVFDNECAMKIGTDALILGSWCSVEGVYDAVDFGTGSGIIAFMVAQRAAGAKVVGVELEPKAFEQSVQNAACIPFADRLKMFGQSVQDFALKAEFSEAFDLVVSNPPYFHGKPKSPIHARNLARHDDSLSLTALLNSARQVLKPQGRFAVVWPMERKEELLLEAEGNGFQLMRICEIAGTPMHDPVRFVSEWSLKSRASQDLKRSEIVPERLDIELTERTHGRPLHSIEYKRLLDAFVKEWA